MDRQGLLSKFKNKPLLILLALLVPTLMVADANQSKNGDVKGVSISIPTILPSNIQTPTYTPIPTPTTEPTSSPIPTITPVIIYPTPTTVIQNIQPTFAPSTELETNKTYTNVDGNEIHSPANSIDGSVPAGATARCRDGTFSFSKHKGGTCSHHGGVEAWL